LAWDYAQQQLEERERQATYESAEKREQREQKRAANKVDVGVGQPSTPTNDWERDYAKAKATGSAVELAKFLIPNRGK
jgi:sRNA-binding protein